jgi:hypothetical protein
MKWRREGKLTPVLVWSRGVRYRRSDVETLRDELERDGWQPWVPRPEEDRHPCGHAECGKPIVNGKYAHRRFCSRRCENLQAIKSIVPKADSPLGWFLKGKALTAIEQGESLPAFCDRHGVTRAVMLALIAGRQPVDRTLVLLRQVYGDTLPKNIISESDDRRSRLPATPHEHTQSPEARAKRRKSIRQHRTERAKREQEILARDESDPERVALIKTKQDALAKRRETQEANPDRTAEARRKTAEHVRSPEHRARLSIHRKLAAHKRNRPEKPMPSPAERQEWRQEFEAALQVKGVMLSPAEIDEGWKRAEVQLGLRHAGGRRPADDERLCEVFRSVRQELGWDGRGKAPRRYDVIVGERLGLHYTGAHTARRRHERRCASCSKLRHLTEEL